jgi:molybdopterin-guanine dinucleotide biosynthesis protein A
MMTDVTGVLLAGGKSRRMGGDKRFLLVGGHTLLEWSLAALRSLFQTVLVVIAQDSPPLKADVPVLRDLVQGCGSLGGLYTGLQQAPTEHVFVAACDMPFLDPAVIRYMAGFRTEADLVMASYGNKLHPTHALYGRRCLPVVEEMIEARRVKIQELVAHPSLRVRLITEAELEPIDPEGRSFLNVNRPSDLETVRKLLADTSGPSSTQ